MALQTVWTEELRVKSFECDLKKRWKPVNVLQVMAEAAGAHASHLGVGFDALDGQAMVWVLSRVKISWRAVPTQGDTLRLRTWPKGLQQRLFFMRDFLIDRPDGSVCIAASTAWLLMDLSARKLLPPKALKTPLPDQPEFQALEEPLEKIVADGPLTENLVRNADYSAIDLLGHTNSARYLDWIGDCFPVEFYRQNFPAYLQINYSSEVKPGEQVSLASGASVKNRDVTFIEGTNLTTGARAFEAEVGWQADR